MLGTTEWLIIAGAAILLFGAPKVISWARALGQARKEFDDATKSETKATKV